MTHGTVDIQSRNGVCILTLNRPERLNALNLEVAEDLQSGIGFGVERGTRAFLLTGAGRAFCAGGDLQAVHEIGSRQGRVEAFFDEPLKLLHDTILMIRTTPVPFIAAVNGVASGAGCNLALACDLVIAANSARFNQAFIKVGLSPDCGGTYILPRLVGWRRATELMFTGDIISAEEALEMGMINSVVADTELMDQALALAERLAAAPTAAIGQTKRLLEASAANNCIDQLDLEREVQIESGKTKDFIEGVSAFLEKRPARFIGG